MNLSTLIRGEPFFTSRKKQGFYIRAMISPQLLRVGMLCIWRVLYMACPSQRTQREGFEN